MGIAPNLQQVNTTTGKYLLPLSVVHALFTPMFVNNTLSLGHYNRYLLLIRIELALMNIPFVSVN